MGMFDDVTYEAPCPMCGAPLTRWQSKSGGCGLEELTPRELWEQRGNPYYRDQLDDPAINFYENCGKCGTWVEIHVSAGQVDWTDEDKQFGVRSDRRMPPRRTGPVLS